MDGREGHWGCWKTAYHQRQIIHSLGRCLPCFCTRYITRAAAVSLSHPIFAKASTTQCTCKACQWIYQQSSRGSSFMIKVLFMAKSYFTNIQKEHTWPDIYVSSCDSISILAVTVYHQPLGWIFGDCTMGHLEHISQKSKINEAKYCSSVCVILKHNPLNLWSIYGVTTEEEIRIAVTFQEGPQGTYSYKPLSLFWCPETTV